MLRYELYKPSGIEWLGEIPAEWTLKKSKFLWREKEDRSLLGDEVLLSVSQYFGVVPSASESRSESLEDYKKCEPNDLVINIMLAWMNGLGVSKYSGIVSPAYCVYRQLENHNPQYFGYLYRTPQYLAEFARRSKGIVPSRWRMYTDDFGQVLTLLPPRVEQDCIVDFLDEKTAEIDTAIARKQRLIELLQEQNNLLINQAVTRGLNPDVPMRDSGVEWIGQIPAHWRLLPNKALFRERNEMGLSELPILSVSLHSGVSDKEQDGEENVRAKVRIEDKTGYKRVYPGDVVYNMMRAWQGAIGVVRVEGLVSPAYVVAAPRAQINGAYFEYLYRTYGFIREMDRYSKGITDFRKRLYWDEFKQLASLLPPLEEQVRIAAYAEQTIQKTTELVEKCHSEIAAMNELRTCIIANVVTGQMKV